MKRKIVIAILCAAVSMGTVGCGNSTASAKKTQTQTDKKEDSKSENSEKSSEEKQSRDIFAMDTYMTVTAYGEHASEAVDKAETEIKRLDEMLSTGNENSEVYKLNQNGEAVVSDDTAYLYERSEKIYKQTKGVFDISIYPVMDAWGFTTENYRIPAEDELSALLKNVDASKIQYDKKTKKITLPKNVKIDFGGIAKGYTSSRIMQIYKKCGVTSGLVSLGGNVQLLGAKPDGSAWKVAVESPDEDGNYLGILQAKDKAVITSGGYERYFEKNGKKYHHIIDPATGYPAENGLTSVTIVSDDGTLADGLSTSLFIMGKEKAEKFWKKYSDKFDVILLTDDDQLYVSEGIADDFQSDYKVKIIDKDGTLVTDAAPFKDAAVGTEFQITVTSTGYTTPLTFTYKVPGETPAPSEVDTTKLAAAIEKAEGLNESDYTKDSWKALQSELTKAKSALEAKESQDTVDKAADSLNKAIDALEAATPDEPTKEVSTDALEKAIKAAGALKESDYTADSWKALQSALAEADTALKEKKNQDTVDKATEKLNKAISALVKKDAGQKVNGTNGTTGTSGKSGKTGSTLNTKSGKAAKTGDPSSMFAWLGLAVTSLGAGIGGFSLKRKKREDEE